MHPMAHIDGFQTTDSFRFDRNRSSSSISLSSSSGYGSRLSLSPNDPITSQRRLAFTKYVREKLSKHKSLASLFSPAPVKHTETEIYDHVWNLDEQIEKLRSKVVEQQPLPSDTQSIVSMSVDAPARSDDEELLSAAAWYQEGLSRPICEEYLNDDHRPIGSFLLRRSYTYAQYPFVLSIRTDVASVEHFLIERTPDEHAYRLKGSSKLFDNLSTLVLHHTVIPDMLPVTLVLTPSKATPRAIRPVRF